MAFDRPTLQEISDRITADFEAQIEGATGLFRRSVLYIKAKVYAAAVHLLYGYLEYQADQLFVTTADETSLDNHASEFGIVRTGASKATATISVTGTAAILIPKGTVLTRSDSAEYVTDADYTIASSDPSFPTSVGIEAKLAGEDYNDKAGITLTFSSPIVGVTSTAVVSSAGISGGADKETDDDLRERVLTRRRKPPHGGSLNDYVEWAKEVSGVTRAWSFSEWNGNTGTVGLAFMRDDDPVPIPGASLREDMKEYIIEHTDPSSGETVGIPVTAEPLFTIITLTELTVNFTIGLYPNTDAVQEEVKAEIKDLILREGGPGQTLYLSQISEAASAATGEERNRIVAPTIDITALNTQVHVLGTVTFEAY